MTSLIRIRGVIPARVYASHWLVDCPVCNSAAPRNFGDPTWDCPDCGALYEVRWPTADMRRGIERLLSMRPIAHTRNWFPGETLHDLLAENIAHGIGPQAEGQSMLIIGDRIERDALPKPVRRLQIGA